MCLGIPVEVLKVSGSVAQVNAGGVTREANLLFLENVGPGDYVILHAGFAIEKIDPAEAKKTLEMIREISG